MVRTTSGLTGVSTGSSFVNSGSKFNTSRLFFCEKKKMRLVPIRIPEQQKVTIHLARAYTFMWQKWQNDQNDQVFQRFKTNFRNDWRRRRRNFRSIEVEARPMLARKKSYNFGSEWRFDLAILEILPFDVLEENVMLDGLFASVRSNASQSLRYIFLHKL